MKKIRLSMLAFAVAGAALLVGCDNPEKMKDMPQEAMPKMDPNPLVLVGKNVKGKISGNFPPKYFHKKAILELTPVLVYDGGELALPAKRYQGEDVTENNPVINNEMGGAYSQEFDFEYKDAMMQSAMELRLAIYFKDEKIPFDQGLKVGIGVNVTQLLADYEAQPALMDHGFQRDRDDSKEAQFNFAIQKADIRSGEYTKDDVKELQKVLKELSTDEKQSLKGMSIRAYASPDGPVALNDDLSKGRGKSTQRWLSQTLKKHKLDASLVSVDEETTDWDGFKRMVEESNIEDKDMILRVLSMYSDPEVRNREMHNLGKVFQVIAEDILPKLRRARMIATFDIQGRTDDEIRDMVREGKVEELAVAEALYAATLSDDLGDKEKIYKEVAEKHNNIAAYNNLAWVYLKEDKLEAAKAALEKAAAINEADPYVLNNQGVIAMREGNDEEAEKLFVRATDAGDVVKGNLGGCAIMKGEYQAAVEYLSGTGVFNQGLALLLTDKLDAAKNVFTELKTAKSYYALAIIGARNGDEKMVLDNLRTAFEIDGKLKDRAKKDVEFVKFLQNEVLAGLMK